MQTDTTADHYNQVADWWLEQMNGSVYGIAALKRSLKFLGSAKNALDVGCGCEGRFIKLLGENNIICDGLDGSSRMIELARERLPDANFVIGDIRSWDLPRKYDLITAWDSIFHLPLESHEAVLTKLCCGLTENGVLLFTCGGGETCSSASGDFGGKQFYYSTLGLPEFIRILERNSMAIRHLEYDQYPENHVVIISQKVPPQRF
ncbi:MAG: class I SAM-dependent methyltransferase [Deltaproteobacteria bacterium]|nr:class I SAM-dependent methyltransferase [Deltaproteobacteria bacterium]